jgi:hypothetical protein
MITRWQAVGPVEFVNLDRHQALESHVQLHSFTMIV